jgi:hypothetical protein
MLDQEGSVLLLNNLINVYHLFIGQLKKLYRILSLNAMLFSYYVYLY